MSQLASSDSTRLPGRDSLMGCSRGCWWLCAVALLVHIAAGPLLLSVQAGESAKVSPTVRTFINNHCVKCHGAEEQNGSVRHDTLPDTIHDESVAQQWQDILDVLNLEEMPPEDEPQPNANELADVLELLTDDLRDARKRLSDTGGEVILRRLNQREYRQTILRLFGEPVDEDLLPTNGSLEGFDTVGQVHNFSSLHLDRYLKLGRRTLDRAIVDGDPRPARPVRIREDPEELVSSRVTAWMPRTRQQKQARLAKEGKLPKNAKQPKPPSPFQKTVYGLVDALSEDYLDRPENQTGISIPFRGLVPNHVVKVPQINQQPGLYRFRVRCGVASNQPAEHLYLKVRRGEITLQNRPPQSVDYFQVTGTLDDPQVIEFTVSSNLHESSNVFRFERRHDEDISQLVPPFLGPTGRKQKYYVKHKQIPYLYTDQQPDIWIDSIEVEGPLPEAAAPLGAKALFRGKSVEQLTDEDIRDILQRAAFEAFRHRAPETEYIDHLEAIYKNSREQGADLGDALKDALSVILASPRFLYLYETQSGKADDSRPLDGIELATRLSYFLWSAPPDEELYRVAKSGRLTDSKVLLEQFDRMLASEESDVFIETFLTQWLELERLEHVDSETAATDSKYDLAVQDHSRKEVYAFFRTLVDEDLPLTNLIQSDFLVVDGLMAKFYGIDGVEGDEFQKVSLPEKSPRGGLLGQSAILALTGTGDRTSPVERGVYVLRKLLNRPPPPAPANVPMLDEAAAAQQSIRDSLNNHMAKSQCMSCHRRIDPLGFALENFDPVGAWRTETKSKDGKQSFPIDTAGVMPDGERRFRDADEMKQLIGADRDAMLHGLTEALMTYSLGRTIGFSDQPLVEQIVSDVAKKNYGARSLLHAIVLSDAFRTK